MIRVSYRLVSLRTSSTVMSRALMSSRAVTAVSVRALRRIRGLVIVESVGLNIGQNGGREQSAHFVDRAARERGTDRAGGNRLRRDGLHHDRSGRAQPQGREVGRMAALPLPGKMGRHAVDCKP